VYSMESSKCAVMTKLRGSRTTTDNRRALALPCSPRPRSLDVVLAPLHRIVLYEIVILLYTTVLLGIYASMVWREGRKRSKGWQRFRSAKSLMGGGS
jgi:hypothetical protein